MSRNIQTQSKMNRSRKGTYPVDVMLLLPVELQDALEVSVHHLAEIELRLPDLVLFALSEKKILGYTGLDNRPAYPLDGLRVPRRPVSSAPNCARAISTPRAIAARYCAAISSAIRGLPLGGCDTACGVSVPPDLRALVGTSEVGATVTFRLSRARGRSNQQEANMPAESRKADKKVLTSRQRPACASSSRSSGLAPARRLPSTDQRAARLGQFEASMATPFRGSPCPAAWVPSLRGCSIAHRRPGASASARRWPDNWPPATSLLKVSSIE